MPRIILSIVTATQGFWPISLGCRREDVLAAADGTVHLWDVTGPAHPQPSGPPLVGRADAVHRVAFSPYSRTLASGGSDETLRLWDVTDPGRPVVASASVVTGTGGVLNVGFSPDGGTFAVAGQDHTVA